ncbi:MAG TPA: branched-chain amino acid aminotransferase [Saprospiraceae bacterium]|jgi:branched-chain amino acid aminotransferase|nr:branched-chain amino acid aminotransferase [Saprospiraceae bacterium]HQW24970.1 branched-chain amino acid aminotransferase [Saprospiraceae bacterium]
MKDLTIHHAKESRVANVDFHNLPFGKIISDHMFEIDYDGKQWVNPRISPVEKMSIHPMNMALHYGQSIFEGMKASRSKDGTPLLFRPELHAKRMNASAVRMCMPEIPEDIFVEAIHAIVGIDQEWIPKIEGSAMYIRPLMFATDEMVGVKASDTYKFMIICLPVGPYYPKPIKLLVEPHYIRAAQGGVGEAKTAGNYAAALYPSKLAREQGYDQVLWLDAVHHKFVQEVGTMNIFFVFNNEIVTPATSGTILKGITRASTLEILRGNGHTVNERDLSIDEVLSRYQAGELIEVFGTGTAALIANVEEIKYDNHFIRLDSSNWALSTSIKDEINGMRFGTIEDKRGWTVPVKEVAVTA